MLIDGNNMRTKLHVGLIIVSLFFMSGCTTFHSAAAKGNVKAIERLYNEGENINQPDDMGVTPLIHAITLNQKESLLALLKAGADVNVGDAVGNTPLHHAIAQGSISFTRILLEKGADVASRNQDGKTPLDLAINTHNEEMIALIKSHSKVQIVVQEESVKETTGIVKQEIKAPVAVKIEPVVEVKEAAAVIAIEKASPKISDAQASATLKRLIAKHETIGVRNFLNEHPETIALISDSRQQLRYVGPSGWRIMDIAEGLARGVLKEEEVIAHIDTAALPYKPFSEDEIRIILHYGISNKIISSMMNATH